MKYNPQPIRIASGATLPIELHMHAEVGISPTVNVYLDNGTYPKTLMPDIAPSFTEDNGKISKVSFHVAPDNNGKLANNLIVIIKP